MWRGKQRKAKTNATTLIPLTALTGRCWRGRGGERGGWVWRGEQRLDQHTQRLLVPLSALVGDVPALAETSQYATP